MTKSPPRPSPVPVRRYRYSKWRWRALVRAFDAIGAIGIGAWRRVRPPAPFEPPRRVLVVQLDHLGDAVLTSPLLERLRAAYPGAAIDVLASPSNREVFEADPNIRRVHVAARSWFDRRRGHAALASAVWQLGTSLRRERYDLGIDVRGDVLSVLVLTLAGIPRRLGWAMGGGGFLLTDVAAWVPGRHEVESRLALLERLGVGDDAPARVSVPVSDDDRVRVGRRLRAAWRGERKRARRAVRAGLSGAAAEPRVVRPAPGPDEPDQLHAGRFGAAAPLLAVHLGAGTAAKRWPATHWRALLARFLDDGWRVIVVGGADDSHDRLPAHRNLRDWTGRLSVLETTALLERADLFLGADSGPAHLAACAGVPSVVLFSGTNRARQWRPWSRRSLVLRRAVACRPCHRKVCPLADHPCLAGIAPDRVYRAAQRWWARLHREESPHAPI
jgi:heptosyltransferase-2